MRWYSISINDDEITLTQDLDNPNGLEIQFSIQQYEAGTAVNSTITIYNLPLYLFGQYQYLYNTKFEFKAGMLSTPLTKAAGITTDTEQMIFVGYTSAIIPDWNGADTQFSFILQPSPVYGYDESGNLDTTLSPGGYQFNLAVGDNPISQITQALNSVTNSTAVLVNRAGTITVESPCYSPVFTVPSLCTVLKTMGLQLYNNAEGYILDKVESTAYGKIVTLKSNDFITQPSALNLGTISCSFVLRGDLRIRDVFKLPSDIFLGISNLASSGARDYRDTVNASLDKSLQNTWLFFSGYFMITKIWHVGDSRNMDVNAWTTIVEAVKYTGIS